MQPAVPDADEDFNFFRRKGHGRYIFENKLSKTEVIEKQLADMENMKTLNYNVTREWANNGVLRKQKEYREAQMNKS
jgi:hypothetical protein